MQSNFSRVKLDYGFQDFIFDCIVQNVFVEYIISLCLTSLYINIFIWNSWLSSEL